MSQREARKQKWGGDARCYLCGEMGSDTTEHVVGRCFYAGKIANGEDVLTLPAHLRCNQSTSKDEEWIARAFAITPPDPSVPSARIRWERAMRAIGRPEAERMGRAFVNSVEPIPGGALVNVDSMRLLYVLAKIAKGLHFERTGDVIGPEFGWRFSRIAAEVFFLAPLDQTRELGDVFAARYGEFPTSLGWWFAFYGSHHFIVTAQTPEQSAIEVSDMYEPRKLSWPKSD